MINLINQDIETMMIGSAIAYPSNITKSGFLKSTDFGTDYNSALWQKISETYLEGRKPIPHIIAAEMYQDEVKKKDCIIYLSECISSCISPDAHDLAVTIKELSDRRKIVYAAEKMRDEALNTSCGKTAAEISGDCITNIVTSNDNMNDMVLAYSLGEEVVKSLDTVAAVSSTGFKRLDKALAGGFYRHKFYGMAARQKSGKSLLMSTIAYQMVMNNNARVLYISLEMEPTESYQRLLSMEMGINSLRFLEQNVRSQKWFKDKVSEANNAFKEAKLYYRSRPRMDLGELKSIIARAGMSGLVDGIIVDYLQLVEGKSSKQSMAEHYDNVAQTLAEASKKYDIWVMTAAQLNQEGNIRGGEGLLNACDVTFAINKVEGCYESQIPDRAWLEMKVSRYTPFMNVGSKDVPAYEIDVNRGPMFVEL